MNISNDITIAPIRFAYDLEWKALELAKDLIDTDNTMRNVLIMIGDQGQGRSCSL